MVNRWDVEGAPPELFHIERTNRIRVHFPCRFGGQTFILFTEECCDQIWITGTTHDPIFTIRYFGEPDVCSTALQLLNDEFTAEFLIWVGVMSWSSQVISHDSMIVREIPNSSAIAIESAGGQRDAKSDPPSRQTTLNRWRCRILDRQLTHGGCVI